MNKKQLKKPINMADRFRVQKNAQNYVKVLHPPPPTQERKEYGANLYFRKNKFFEKKIEIQKSRKRNFKNCERKKMKNLFCREYLVVSN